MSLLVLFVMYQVSITAFTHVHCIDGVLITHSHPFQGSHSHTETSFAVIGYLSSFSSSEPVAYEELNPVRPLLAVLYAATATPMAKGEPVITLFLRAPPCA